MSPQPGDEEGADQPVRRVRRHRRASHPGTSEAARAASEQGGDAPAPRRRRPSEGPSATDAREQWLLDERPPHWG